MANKIIVSVDKYGGKTASVVKPVEEDTGSLQIVRGITKEKLYNGKKAVIVVSAFSNTTDCLVKLEEMIREGRIKDEKEIRQYVDGCIAAPHFKLSKDTHIYMTTKKGIETELSNIVESALALLESKNKLNLPDSLLGVYSPVPFKESIMKGGSDLTKRLHDYEYITDYLRARDMLVTAGERLILPIYKESIGNSRYFKERKIGIVIVNSKDLFVTDKNYGSANINLESSRLKIEWNLSPLIRNPKYSVFIVPGFFGADSEGRITCFGRGGSDLTAVALAYFLSLIPEIKVEGPCLTKDTDGILVVNPKEVYSTKSEKINIPLTDIPQVSYDSIPQISNLNYKDSVEIEAVHVGAVYFAKKHGMTIYVRRINPYFESKATTISGEPTTSGHKLISGTKDAVFFKTEGCFKDEPGEWHELTSSLYKYGINISKSFHDFSDTFLVLDRGNKRLSDALKEMGAYEPITLSECSKVKVSGDVLPSDRIDFENMSRNLDAYAISPFIMGYKQLSAIIPRFHDREGLDFYRAALTAYYYMWHGKPEYANSIVKILRSTFLSGDREKG